MSAFVTSFCVNELLDSFSIRIDRLFDSFIIFFLFFFQALAIFGFVFGFMVLQNPEYFANKATARNVKLSRKITSLSNYY